MTKSSESKNGGPRISAALSHNQTTQLPIVTSTSKYTFNLNNGMRVLDGSGGAAVSCFGYTENDEIEGILASLKSEVPFYTPNRSLSTQPVEDYAEALVHSTEGAMAKAYICNSGSDAIETAMKLSCQYHWNRKDRERTWFIARHESYHGATLGALSISGHRQRREVYEGILLTKCAHISSCNPYRDRKKNQSLESYVQEKAKELSDKFKELGPNKVIAFMLEPVSGASLGCVAAVPGYLKAMKAVCDHYGALLIFDEVMCGTGRTGTMHAWQQHGVTPDIQMNGKGLGAGVLPISAVLCNHRVANGLRWDTKSFAHGFTHQNHTLICQVGLKVLQMIQRNLGNIKRQGQLLHSLLHQNLDDHPHVGDIRGVGLFFGIEFVKSKATKEPFDPKLDVSERFHRKAMRENKIYVYPGSGCIDGTYGDHIIIAPQYNIDEDGIRLIVKLITDAITEFFPYTTKSRL